MTAQPPEITRLSMFFAISMMVVFVAQSFGLMIGAVFNVVVSSSIYYITEAEIPPPTSIATLYIKSHDNLAVSIR